MVAFMLCVNAVAQSGHLKFMGISLDGKIDNFQSKLLAKGEIYELDPEVRNYVKRTFHGTFSGYRSYFTVYYNPRNEIVYRAKASINKTDENTFHDLESKLDAKYGKDCKKTVIEKDDSLKEHKKCTYQLDNGTISLYYGYERYFRITSFYINIDYIDAANDAVNKHDEMEDL